MSDNISGSSKRFDFARASEVLLQPQRTFGILAEESRPSWLTPLLILSASTLLTILVRGSLTARASLMGEMQLPPDWQYWTPDMQNNYMQSQQVMQGPVFIYVIPLVSALVSLWLGWLILSGLLHLGSTLLGGRGTMQNALNMAGWASLPFALRDALRILYMLLAGHAIKSQGLSGFAGDAVFLGQILAQLDVFLVWKGILLVFGFGAADKLSRERVILAVAVVMVILLLAQAGIGTLLSNLGGLAVQRPFL